MVAEIRYAIVCSPRTGSSYLCQLLESCGRAGRPTEHFNVDNTDMIKQLGDNKDIVHYGKTLLKNHTFNGVYGTKVVGTREPWEDFHQADLGITHWIRLDRADRLMQAISDDRANQTRQWYDKGKKEIKESFYQPKGIQRSLDKLETEGKIFDEFFKDKDYLSFIYETDIEQFPERTVTKILDYLGINSKNLPPIKTELKKQRNMDSYLWKVRFMSEDKYSAIV